MAVQTDIGALVPRVRRAVEGAGQPQGLSDAVLYDMVADAISDITLYLGSVFGKQIIVTLKDPITSAPTKYATTDELSLQEGTVIASQAALNYFFFKFAGMKVHETIADEASQWDYDLSPQLLTAQLKLLVGERDKALEALRGQDSQIDVYVNFLAVRDIEAQRAVEPWLYGANQLSGGGGMAFDPRFGTVG